MVPRELRYFRVSAHSALPEDCSQQSGWNFGASAHSARKWFPGNGVVFGVSPHFVKTVFLKIVVFSVSARTLPENGSQKMVLGNGSQHFVLIFAAIVFPEMAIGEIGFRLQHALGQTRFARMLRNLVCQRALWQITVLGIVLELLLALIPAVATIRTTHRICRAHAKAEEILPRIRSASHSATVQFLHIIQQVEPTPVLSCMFA